MFMRFFEKVRKFSHTGESKVQKKELAINKQQLFFASVSSTFLRLVNEGKQEQAEELLLANSGLIPQLFLQKSSVANHDGLRLTAFQDALYSLDRHMWQMLMKYLSKEEAAKQLHELDQLPESAEHKAEKKREAHCNFDELINALQHVITVSRAFNDLKTTDSSFFTKRSELGESLKKAILQLGHAQRKLPSHVENEYCRLDRSFHPTPNFDDTNLPRIQFGWEPKHPKSKLGIDFAIIRHHQHSQVIINSKVELGWIEVTADLAAITNLYNVRIRELNLLKENLPAPTSNEEAKQSISLNLSPVKAFR